jgi:hypothetical protein
VSIINIICLFGSERNDMHFVLTVKRVNSAYTFCVCVCVVCNVCVNKYNKKHNTMLCDHTLMAKMKL